VRGSDPELGGRDGTRRRRGEHREVPDDEGDEEGEYEIPPEVLPFLSRAEIAQMKRNRGGM
jgi:hypothetical protein